MRSCSSNICDQSVIVVSLNRIYLCVILMESVKYVTYFCSVCLQLSGFFSLFRSSSIRKSASLNVCLVSYCTGSPWSGGLF